MPMDSYFLLIMFVVIVLWAYFVAALPSAYCVVALTKNISIYQHGSQSGGTTNVVRVAGWKAGSMTLFLDVTKGLLAMMPLVFLLYWLGDFSLLTFSLIAWKEMIASQDNTLILLTMLITPLCAILGHIYPIYTRFHGGKGVVIFMTSFFFLAPFCVGIGFILWLLFLCLLRISSVASLMLVTSATIASVMLTPWIITMALFIGALLVIFKHSSNIKQLLRTS